jgi:hypothetical protein
MALDDPPDESTPTVSLPQLCYDVAYFILPHYAFESLARLEEICLNYDAVARTAGNGYECAL